MHQNEKDSLMIIHDLDNTQVGAKFDAWPLHITILFYLTHNGIDESIIINHVAKIIEKTGPIHLTTGTNALYGTGENIPVTKMNDPTGKLSTLHSNLLTELTNLGCQFDDMTYTLANYSPHITHIESRTGPESEYTINHISVVKKVPEQSEWTKKILAKFTL